MDRHPEVIHRADGVRQAALHPAALLRAEALPAADLPAAEVHQEEAMVSLLAAEVSGIPQAVATVNLRVEEVTVILRAVATVNRLAAMVRPVASRHLPVGLARIPAAPDPTQN